MYINKISIPLNEDNFKILYDMVSDEIVTNININCDYENKDIIIQ